MKKILVALLGLSLVTGCAGAPFAPGKPVEIEGSALGRSYRQGGARVDRNNMMEHLRSGPETSEKANSARTWEIVAAIPGVAGGFLVGYYAFADVESRGLGIGIGAGLIVLAAGLGAHAEGELSDAVGIYNHKLSGGEPKKKSSLMPIFEPVAFRSPGEGYSPGILGTWRF
ncbi:MAG TPA: hypothetical protein VM598_03880 [Bdellovibrionota bacterium]|nr:hypothetical protein [Bdellovibrionota bacterium]